MSKICDAVSDLVKPIIESNGMELVEVEYKKLYGTHTLIIYIDKEGGVSLDDCEKIHRIIDEPLDVLDPTNGAPYNLNVSSPGLDRPLKTARDYDKNINKEVDISLYMPVDGEKKLTCKLIAYDDETVTVEKDGKEIKLNKKQIAAAKPTIRF